MSGDTTIQALERLSHMPDNPHNPAECIAGQKYYDVAFTGGSISGVGISGLTTPLAIADGGTGQITKNAALNALLPTQTGLNGRVLSTNGNNTSWTVISGMGTVTSVDVSGGTTGITTSGGPITAAGTITLAGLLVGDNGGTGVANTGKTITLGGNLTTAGAFATTLTSTALTSVVLPTAGTLATRAGTETFSNKTLDNSNTWNGGVVAGQYGGTGVANTGKTITIGGNFTTAGAFTTTLNVSANSSVTLPAAGTLATLAGTETFTNKTYDTAGTGNVFKINGNTISTISGNTSKVATTNGTLTTGHFAAFDASGNVVDGGASGLPAAITGALSGSSTVFTVDFTTYSAYRILLDNVTGTGTANLTVDVSTDGGSTYATATRNSTRINSTTVSNQTNDGALANLTPFGSSGDISQSSTSAGAVYVYTGFLPGNSTQSGGGNYATSAAINRVKITASGGTFTGNVILQPLSAR